MLTQGQSDGQRAQRGDFGGEFVGGRQVADRHVCARSGEKACKGQPLARQPQDDHAATDEPSGRLGDRRKGTRLDAVWRSNILAAGYAVWPGPEAREALGRFTASRRSPTLEVIRRGIDRGEIPAGTDPDVLADLLAGAVVFRVLVRGDRVGRVRVESYVTRRLGIGS